MARQFSARQEAECIKRAFPTLRFISGKWFLDGVELQNPKRFFMTNDMSLTSVDKVQQAMDVFVMLYGEETDWLELPIIEEARGQKELKPLCFPLTKKQLMIINRLLIGGADEVFFICTGVGGSGKSTFLNIVQQIFDKDVSSCPLNELSGFQLAEALKHRLIAADELNASDIDNGAVKTIVSRQKLQVNPKYDKAYQTKAQSAMFFCCNIAPRIELADTGMLRRIVYHKMDKKIVNPDTSLKARDWTREDLVNIVAHALALDTTNWKDEFKDETRYYLLKHNSVFIFRNESTSYEEYLTCCRKSNLKPFSEPKYDEIMALITEWELEDPAVKACYEQVQIGETMNILSQYKGTEQLISQLNDFCRGFENGIPEKKTCISKR